MAEADRKYKDAELEDKERLEVLKISNLLEVIDDAIQTYCFDKKVAPTEKQIDALIEAKIEEAEGGGGIAYEMDSSGKLVKVPAKASERILGNYNIKISKYSMKHVPEEFECQGNARVVVDKIKLDKVFKFPYKPKSN